MRGWVGVGNGFRMIQAHCLLCPTFINLSASLVAQMVKNLPAMRETWIRSLGWEDSLEKGMETHSSILAWRIPWDCKELDMIKQLILSVELKTI